MYAESADSCRGFAGACVCPVPQFRSFGYKTGRCTCINSSISESMIQESKHVFTTP